MHRCHHFNGFYWGLGTAVGQCTCINLFAFIYLFLFFCDRCHHFNGFYWGLGCTDLFIFFIIFLLNYFLHFDRIYCDLCECYTVCVCEYLFYIYLRLWMLCCWIIWDFECCVVEYLFETLNVMLLYVNVVWLSIYLRP